MGGTPSWVCMVGSRNPKCRQAIQISRVMSKHSLSLLLARKVGILVSVGESVSFFADRGTLWVSVFGQESERQDATLGKMTHVMVLNVVGTESKRESVCESERVRGWCQKVPPLPHTIHEIFRNCC